MNTPWSFGHFEPNTHFKPVSDKKVSTRHGRFFSAIGSRTLSLGQHPGFGEIVDSPSDSRRYRMGRSVVTLAAMTAYAITSQFLPIKEGAIVEEITDTIKVFVPYEGITCRDLEVTAENPTIWTDVRKKFGSANAANLAEKILRIDGVEIAEVPTGYTVEDVCIPN